MRKSILEKQFGPGSDKDKWTRDQIIRWMKNTGRTFRWREDYGLIFIPHIGRETRKRFQEILQVHSKEDTEALRREMRSH